MIRATYTNGYFKEFLYIKDITETENVVEIKARNLTGLFGLEKCIFLEELDIKID